MRIKLRHRPYNNLLLLFPELARSAFKTGSFISLLASLLAVVALFFLQPVIPIFYSLAQADKQLQPKIWLLLYPALSWIILLTHFLIISNAKNLAIAVQKVFAWATVGILVLIMILLTRTVVILL